MCDLCALYKLKAHGKRREWGAEAGCSNGCRRGGAERAGAGGGGLPRAARAHLLCRSA